MHLSEASSAFAGPGLPIPASNGTMASSGEEFDRRIVTEFCHLLEKSKQLFNGLRDLPQYGHKQWQVCNVDPNFEIPFFTANYTNHWTRGPMLYFGNITLNGVTPTPPLHSQYS